MAANAKGVEARARREEDRQRSLEQANRLVADLRADVDAILVRLRTLEAKGNPDLARALARKETSR